MVDSEQAPKPAKADLRPLKRGLADSLKCGTLSFLLSFGPWTLGTLLGQKGPAPGSALDWLMLVLVSLAFISVPVALLTLALVVADLWRRRPMWQIGLGALLALVVAYAWKDFP